MVEHRHFHRILLQFLLILTYQLIPIHGSAADDLITDLPGLTFEPGFKQFSGYLRTSSQNNLFYWLVESQNDPENDPLVLWLNGGPGCSSLGGFFNELGPFRVNQDGKTLYENIYSWNKGANVIFIESPRDVGYSYRDQDAKPTKRYNDDLTAEDCADALVDFLERFPQYKGRQFFISGESYAGVYIPTLVNVLVKRIIVGTISGMNLVGMLIGNGYLNAVDQFNSVISIFYWRGMMGMRQFNDLKKCCPEMAGKPLAYCNFSSFVDWPQNNPKRFDDPILNECAQNISVYSMGNFLNDPYNSYMDCYMEGGKLFKRKTFKNSQLRRILQQQRTEAFFNPNTLNSFIDEGGRINIGSTDAQYGSPCWMSQMTNSYLNLPEVRKALHVPSFVRSWKQCSGLVGANYVQQYYDMEPFFKSMEEMGYPLQILIYNGDVDTVCEFLGNEWFVERLVGALLMKKSPRYAWTFQEDPKFIAQLAGYRQNFTGKVLNMDFITVKGAGHFVPLDRGGPALQMLTNFIQGNNFNTSLFWNTTAKETLKQYKPEEKKKLSRKEQDRIWKLPGLTYEPKFKQYSGYLHGVPGDYLHYWFVESQANPKTDPLILWLNGGPGCSSIGGFLTENGPFHPNPDGKTLFENIYSWNKVANVLYLESPRNVGYSYQNTSINPDPSYNDLKTARGTFRALMDFLNVFPEYNNRPFYITGESYAGIYIPTLTAYIIDKIADKKAPGLNLIGIAIGNGELSKKQQLNSIMSLLYYRGIYGTELYKRLMSCCPNNTQPAAYCDFSQLVDTNFIFASSAVPNKQFCSDMIINYGVWFIWFDQKFQDVYNMIEDGYRQPNNFFTNELKRRMEFGSRNLQMFLKLKKKLAQSPVQLSSGSLYPERRSKINYESTDGKGNFYWYQQSVTPMYMNLPDVRAALHIPPFVQNWSDCDVAINLNYNQQWDDTTPLYQRFFRSGYPLRILIYNGDVDMACQFLGDEWFVEELASMYTMPVTQKRIEWTYQSQKAGYWKQFQTPTGTIDLITVKGAGHFVPLDRPGPALQMLNNFLTQANYSTPLPFPVALTPLRREYVIQEQASIAAAPITTESNRAKRSANTLKIKLGTKNDDLINNLNGLTFKPKFKQYSGFLPGRSNAQLHYWLIEANSAAIEKPLIVWLADGPGCSSIYDALIDIGPYRVSSQGDLLYENPYSWNQAANLLFLEAAPGNGFSLGKMEKYDDDLVVSGLQTALNAFFERFEEYRSRKFYLFGKGYGAIYALALAAKVQNATVPLAGIGLANALLNYSSIINTVANEMYFSGILGKSEWDQLIPCCMKADGTYDEDCNLAQYVNIDMYGRMHANDYSNRTLQQCAYLVVKYTQTEFEKRVNPSGNMYRSCYEGTIPPGFEINQRMKRSVGHLSGLPLTNLNPFINQPDRINYRSTDAFASYPCYMHYAVTTYLNQPATQQSMHITEKTQWKKCNPYLFYKRNYFDTMPFFTKFIDKSLKMIVFDGDSHLQNNFLANELFIEKFGDISNLSNMGRDRWTYQKSWSYLQQYAGYIKVYYTGEVLQSANFKLDLLTVKGAGNYIALDRPAPTLQMISNYLSSQDYNTIVEVESVQPLLEAYAPAPIPQATRMEADEIFDLLGLTYSINFRQYSGYLKAATKDAYLHYWLVESQNNPATDPLIIWFNGGPGCSSLGGLLAENGPFRANPDGITLFENVFSWNKLANVLYIESPYNVGFSYREKQPDVKFSWNDTMTAVDAYAAIRDFFTVFPKYVRNDLYIAGESYAGIYVPTLTDLMIKKIKDGEKMNLKGMIVGNGYLSVIQNIRSLPSYMHFHGIYGKKIWDKLMSCCPNRSDKEPITDCDFDKYVEMLSDGEIIPRKNTNETCGKLIRSLAYDRVWDTMNYVYNLYQDCYQQTIPILSFASKQHRQKMLQQLMENNEAKIHPNMGIAYMKALPWSINTFSTDHIGGFPCFMMHSVTHYLNQPHVRDALHIPDYVQDWSFCSANVGMAYHQQYNDTSEIFQSIFNSNYSLRVLIYNGDTDTACSIFEAEWFIENFAQQNNMESSERNPWLYQLLQQFLPQIGGYYKRFNKNKFTIDLVTVKGAGHMVPTDRAGPMLQLLNNFIKKRGYNDGSTFSLERQPLLPQYNV